MEIYMEGESTEATSTVESSSYIWIIGERYPKSREHNEHTWFVVKLRIGPVTTSLKEVTDYNWRTIATWFHDPTCVRLDWHSRNKRFSPLKECVHRRHLSPHQRTCTNDLDQPTQIHQMLIGPFHANAFSYYIYQELWANNHSVILSPLQSASWMLHNIDLVHKNTPYGMMEVQHYSSGQKISNHMS